MLARIVHLNKTTTLRIASRVSAIPSHRRIGIESLK